nr:hypothetical protein [Tanacetum cinerariifolium]
MSPKRFHMLKNLHPAKEDMRKAYKEWKDIPQEKLALIDTFLKAGAWK